ncbi:MAG: hypothetical protein IT233_11880 [Bacteroidia bacterium]|nr:hypothetical protein [Bacteroidia bacterium]
MGEKESKHPLQVRFFKKLKDGLPDHISLVNVLADILSVSTDGIYRRLRGESEVSMDELFTICRHFKVSPEAMVGDESSTASFSFSPLSRKEKQFDEYFRGLYQQTAHIAAIPGHQMFFTAEETPIFHFFNYPSITAFKIYYWNKCVLNAPEYAEKKFEPCAVDPALVAVAKQLYDAYNKVNCTEIWSEKTIVGVLKQFEYVLETGNFASRMEARRVLDEIDAMMKHIRKMAEVGYKFDPHLPSRNPEGAFTMYQLDILMGNITVFIKAGEFRQVYIAFHSFNTLSTFHPILAAETESWLQNMIKRATLISGSAEKQREQFFAAASREIGFTRAKLDKYVF